MADLNFTFDLKGVPEVQAKIVEAIRTMSDQAAAGLYQEAEIEMTESKKRTPVDTGTLRDSGHVQLPVIDGHGVSVTMGFGGAAEDYAIIQHEDLELHHTVGQAKFLESVITEAAPFLAERVAARIKL